MASTTSTTPRILASRMIFPRDLEMISGTVKPLIVLEYSLLDRPREVNFLQDFTVYLAVVFNNAELVLVYQTGLAENLGGHRYLTIIMKQPEYTDP